MLLKRVEIRDFRSIFSSDAGDVLHLDLAEGANSLVGVNNCGKSNILRAISLALDPQHRLDPERDVPGPRPFAYPVVTLEFAGDPTRLNDQAVLDAAEAYERSLGLRETRASQGAVELEVAFVPTPMGAPLRQETIRVVGGHRAVEAGQREALDAAIAALRASVRFVLISSGESIESVLEGNFREILHSVVRDRLRVEFDAAETSRETYISGLQDNLLEPLRERIRREVLEMFPDIREVALAPAVSSIEMTLANMAVSLQDVVATDLSGKGTGVRGGLLVAMLSYLAGSATKSMVFAVEEPEAFLHPAAQEDLRDQLEELAVLPGITLLVTTHSPLVVTRSAGGRIFCITKDEQGRTRVAETAPGTADHAPLLGDLVRPASLESIVASATAVPAGTSAVVLVEGDGDRFCLEFAAQLVGMQDELLGDLHIHPTGGTNKMVVEAVLMRAACDVPVLVLVDNDEHGRTTRQMLTGNHFRFQGSHVLRYSEVFDKEWNAFPVEAEDLFDPVLIREFADEHEASIVGSKMRPDGAFHWDFSAAAKPDLEPWLRAHAQPHHIAKWIELVVLLRDRAGIKIPELSASEILEQAPLNMDAVGELAAAAHDVMVLTGPGLHGRFLVDGVLAVDRTVDVPATVTHVAFYEGGVQRHVPRLLRDYDRLLVAQQTVSELHRTGQEPDRRAAEHLSALLKADDSAAGSTRRILVLSPADDGEATLVLANAVKNTKTQHGKPVAWAISDTVVPFAALRREPSTTDALDAIIEEMRAERGSQ